MRPVPYKRCKALEDKIVKRIHGGASFSDAPRLEGIDESSFRRWRKCEQEEGGNDLTLRDKRCWVCAHCALQRKCDEAESDFKQTCIRSVYKAGEKNWRARAWLLERRYREEYGVRAIVETGKEEPFYDPSRMLVEALISGIHERRKTENQAEKEASPHKEP